jgi:hypothetical protein
MINLAKKYQLGENDFRKGTYPVHLGYESVRRILKVNGKVIFLVKKNKKNLVERFHHSNKTVKAGIQQIGGSECTYRPGVPHAIGQVSSSNMIVNMAVGAII